VTLSPLVLRREMVRAAGVRVRQRKPPRGRASRAARLQYFALLRQMSLDLEEKVFALDLEALARAAVRDGLRQDSFVDDVLRVFRGFSVFQSRIVESRLEAVAAVESTGQQDLFRRQTKALLGVDIIAPVSPEVSAGFVTENLDLIESWERETLERAKRALLHEIQAGTRIEQIKRILSGDFKLSRKKAALIASDQVLRLHGRLTEARQTEAGIEEYFWDSSQDGKVRPRHRELHGTRQRWDTPPIVDLRSGRRAHPGQDYRCRCVALPIIADVDEKTYSFRKLAGSSR
jgi:SPP1 gp7 family putative phage head morphogenesis protein